MSADPNQSVPMNPTVIESRVGNGPIPIWFILLAFLGLYGGMVYFDHHSGWFHPEVYAPYTGIDDVNKWQPPAGGGGLYDQGRLVYNKPTCVTCHQLTGSGTPGQYPPLAGSDWVSDPDPDRLIRIVLNGLSGPVTVNGKSFNNVMIPWKDSLSDTEIAAVLTFVRQNKEWGNNFPPVKPEQVTAIRAQVGNRSQAWTEAELPKPQAK